MHKFTKNVNTCTHACDYVQFVYICVHIHAYLESKVAGVNFCFCHNGLEHCKWTIILAW